MQLLFERPLVAHHRKVGEPYERGQPELDIEGRRLFVGSSDHGLYALSAVNGSTQWRFETLGFVQCAPLYDPAEDSLYFGSNDGALYKVAARTGKLIWRFSTNAEVARRPVLSSGTLYAVNANDTLIAVDSRTGKLKFSQHRTPAMGMEVAGYSGPALYKQRVYVGFSDGTITAFDAQSGDEVWQPVDLSAEAEQLLGEIPAYLDVDTTPLGLEIAAGPAVVVGSYVGGVYALDAQTGSQIWSNPNVAGVTDVTLWEEPPLPTTLADGAAPRSPGRLLLVSTGTSGLWALNPDTGDVEWRQALPEGGISAPVPVHGALLVTASQLGVFLMSPLDGSLIDGIHLTAGASAAPAAHGSRAFVLGNGGSLFGLHITPPGPPAPRAEHWF